MPNIAVNSSTAIVRSVVEILDDADHFISLPNRQVRSNRQFTSITTINNITTRSSNLIVLPPPPVDPLLLPFTVIDVFSNDNVTKTKFFDINSSNGDFYLLLDNGVTNITIKSNRFSMSSQESLSNPDLMISIANGTDPDLELTISATVTILGEI